MVKSNPDHSCVQAFAACSGGYLTGWMSGSRYTSADQADTENLERWFGQGSRSADIAVPEHDREVRFYSRVLSTGESPFWREDLMNNAGTPIIGLGERNAEYAHLPLQWMPHIEVADVAASVQRGLELGGNVLFLRKRSARARRALRPRAASTGST